MLHQAYLSARKNKRSTADEYIFERNLNINLAELANDILHRNYKPSRGIAFIIEKPVMREIFAAPFRDRVVHHLLYDFVADWWDRRFIYDNYSCRVGKGNLFGIKRLYHHVASVSQNFSKPAYVLKLDLQGYFMSLPRQALFDVTIDGLGKQFDITSREYRLCKYLWQEIIFDDPTIDVKIPGSLSNWDKLPDSKSLFCAKGGCGIVIGNLTSQLLSNIYLNQLDRYVTFDLYQKHYGRYVDDFFITSSNKTELLELVPIIREYLAGIGLILHPKKTVLREISQGIEFLGAVVYPYRIIPGQRLKQGLYKSAHNKQLGFKNSFESYHGLIKHYNHKKWLYQLR